jgi:hypothetical protein
MTNKPSAEQTYETAFRFRENSICFETGTKAARNSEKFFVIQRYNQSPAQLFATRSHNLMHELGARAFPEKAESGDSHFIANQIQESYWQEASMDGKALLRRFAQTSN